MKKINDSHTGWWCLEFQNALDLDARPCANCIPVFKPLDVPEPSTWNYEDVDAVTATVRGKMVFATRHGVVPA